MEQVSLLQLLHFSLQAKSNRVERVKYLLKQKSFEQPWLLKLLWNIHVIPEETEISTLFYAVL